jgi:bifunctional non-homologous end joining protein LigD
LPPDDKLRAYREKRDAGATPEPFGEGTADVPPRVFVVQQHDARRMHWDLRLEIDGVLRSWAVPQGPSLDPEVKRLAVQTEDHPLDYADFEGIIPDGNYGAGPMIVWDRGQWLQLPVTEKEEASGKLLFELRGRKLRGVFTLFPTSKDGREWLLVKKKDPWSRPEGEYAPSDTSIFSGLTVEELATGADRRKAVVDALEELGAPHGDVALDEIQLMLAQTAEHPFTRDGWLFELKYDGYRMLAERKGSQPHLRYRRGRTVTSTYPEVARALTSLPYDDLIMDGEVVVLDDDGRPNFQRLQRRAQLSRKLDVARGTVENPITYYAFDLLAFDGYDLRDLPLAERKRLLRELVPGLGIVRYADEVETMGEALFEQVRRAGLEGIVAKDATSRYEPGRSDRWLKMKADEAEELLIVGYRPQKGESTGIGALHVAEWQDGELVYAGRVGSGLDAAKRKALVAALSPLEQATPPLQIQPSLVSPEDRWVTPRRRAQVRYTDRTDARHLRHPVFLALLDEALPADLVEGPMEPPREATEATTEIPREVTQSNRDKVFWPDAGLTKGDLLDYYDRVAGWLLPYLRGRPLVLDRYPDGITGKSFFQKQAPDYLPGWIETVEVWSGDPPKSIDYVVCNDRETLLYLANLGTIPMHLWASPVAHLDHPDWCILDLDPKEAPFSDVVTLALGLHEICGEIGIPVFVKTSGSTGLHVLVPLGNRMDYEQSRTFGELLSRVLLARNPRIATMARSLQARAGRVYLDYLQNRRGQLLVAPFSVRPLPGAPVSTPLRWEEVGPELDLRSHTLESVPERMAELGEDPMANLLELQPDLLGALERLAELV